ncbi:MAG: hypothetical protein HZA15_05895 [Nitrospirae bacterium]|nr:hypothetical protein [Nitrospirota bacterium]
MKKEYIIGGVLGVILLGIVAYALIIFIGVQNSDTRQLSQQLPAMPVPLDVAAPEPRQAAQEQSPSKRDAGISASAPSDSNKGKAAKTESIKGLRIVLKSGKVIIADACTEFGSLLRCDTPNGAVEVEREDVESMREITIVQRFAAEPQQTAGAAGVGKKDENGRTASGANQPAQPGEGKLVRDLTPVQIKRLDEITERKTVLKPERERLINEREQLHEDVNKMAAIRGQEQYDALKKRISDLEARIIGFNDEVTKLNEEEKTILDSPAVK